ncbi:MAG TPA: hypothetical protein VI758_05535 [Bacteroidota bacterium]
MKTGLCVVTISALLVFANVSVAQQYNITGAGARAEGFGGAFIGVADDATAVVWNPAGLSQLERPEGSIVAKYVMEKVDYTDNTNASNNESTSLNHVVFNFGSLAVPLKIGGTNVVLAAAYQRQLDFYNSYKQPGFDIEEKGGVDTFTPGVGVQLSPLFSLGFSANIWFGKDDYSETYDAPSASSPNTTYNGKPSGFNMVLGGMVDFGGLSKPVPLKIGASVRTPFTLKSDYSYQWSPAFFGVLSEASATQKVEMPSMIGLGASYRIGENLIVAADFETRAYGDKKIFTDITTSFGSISDTSQLSASKKNLNQFRVGAEYLIVTDAGVFPIRAGYRNVPTLIAYRDANGDPTDQQVVGDGFSVGTGFISGSFALDVTFSRLSYQAGGVNSTTDYTQTFITGSLIVYF